MNPIVCRDCGRMLESNIRGCPECALNFEAEAMIDRMVWRRIFPVVIVSVVVVGLVLFYLFH
jgi:hypothetical protein